MKVADLAGIVLLAIVVIGLFGGAGYWLLSRRAGINRAEFTRIRKDRLILIGEQRMIEAATDEYRDMDSPLATKIRAIMRQVNEERGDLQ